jgi:membrane protein implicated in regulation of membrane protease activity
MTRSYLRNVGALLVAVGAMAIITPVGGLMILLGMAMLLSGFALSLVVFATHEVARLSVGAVSAVQERQQQQTAVRSETRQLPVGGHSLRSTG